MNLGKLLVWFLAANAAIQTFAVITLGPWQIRHPHPSDYIRGLAHDGGKFVVVDGYGHVFTSLSGRNWTLQSTPGLQPLRSVAFGGTNFVAVGLNGVILSSPDGTNWVSAASPTTNDLLRIIYTGERFVAVGARGTIISSAAGTEFAVEESPVSKDLLNVDTGPGTIVAAGERTVLVSTNIGEWKQALVTTTNYFADVTHFNGAYHNGYYASTNPMVWTNRVTGLGPSNVVSVAATTNRIARVLANRLQLSSDGTSWGTWFNRARHPGLLTTISNRFQLLSHSGILFGDQFNFFAQMDTTLLIDTNVANYFKAIAANPDGFAAADSLGRIFTSKDAQFWRRRVAAEPVPNLNDLNRGAFPWARIKTLPSTDSRVEVTDDGIAWIDVRRPEAFVKIAGTIGNTIVAAGISNLWATTDRTNWTKIKTKEGPLIYVADDLGTHTESDRWVLSFSRGNGMLVATTSWGELLFSSDGFEWQTMQTPFLRIDDAAIAPEKMVVIGWGAIAEARFDGGVDAVRETKLRLSSNGLEFEGPLRYHEIQRTTNFSAWNFFKTTGTNTLWQLDQSSDSMEFFRAVTPP